MPELTNESKRNKALSSTRYHCLWLGSLSIRPSMSSNLDQKLMVRLSTDSDTLELTVLFLKCSERSAHDLTLKPYSSYRLQGFRKNSLAPTRGQWTLQPTLLQVPSYHVIGIYRVQADRKAQSGDQNIKGPSKISIFRGSAQRPQPRPQ